MQLLGKTVCILISQVIFLQSATLIRKYQYTTDVWVYQSFYVLEYDNSGPIRSKSPSK